MMNAECGKEKLRQTNAAAFCIRHAAFLHSLPSPWWNGDHASVRSSRSRFDSWRGRLGGERPNVALAAGPRGAAFGVHRCLVSVRVSTAPCHGVRTGSSPVRGDGRARGCHPPQ